MDIVSFWVSIIALLVSIASAYFSYRSVKIADRSAQIAERAAQAELLAPFLTQYASTEMRDALVRLGEWRKGETNRSLLERISRLEQFQPTYVKDCIPSARQSIVGDDINIVRRYVHHYFKKAYKLWHNQLLNDNYMRCIIDTEAKDLLHDVVKPLSLAVHLVNICKGDSEEFIKQRAKFQWFDKLKHFQETIS
jgi:hypothetical protein